MTDWRKAKVEVSAVYKNGDVLVSGFHVPARCQVLDIPGAPEKYKELSIRLVVNSRDSEELLEGLVNGSVSLSIEQMTPPNEREVKS